LRPFVWGFALAYLLNRPLNFFEEKALWFLKKKPRLRRYLSVALCFLLFFAILAGILALLIPSLARSLSSLISALPEYLASFNETLLHLAAKLKIGLQSQIILSWDTLRDAALAYFAQLTPDMADAGIRITTSVVGFLTNTTIAVVAGIYLLVSKERFIAQSKKLLFALLPSKRAESLVRVLRTSHSIFTNYLTGKLLQALIVGILNYVAMLVIGLDYALLISVITALFNIIPMFGPVIGAIPCTLLLLVVSPMQAFWFVILTLVLQQLDGQIIGPKILGDSIGLTPFWVIFAIIAGGATGGVLGMILGIPVFALLYSLVVEFTNARLRKLGLSTRSEDYASKKKKL